ncbi:MAG: type IV secretory system conjugative DNA transfer family protein, partial [Planctomycetota bacterium]|nr:type IV secretory system conjugative DNA transfer family protein [Planctomycetota bacterium]
MPTLPKLNNQVGPLIGKKAGRGKTWVRLLTVAFAFTLGLAVASQYFAAHFNYAPELGSHVDGVYFPGAILIWFLDWGEVYPDEFRLAASLGTMAAAIVLIAYLVIDRYHDQAARGNEFIHGSAHWADEKEIRQSGVLPRPPSGWEKAKAFWRGAKPPETEGVYVGAWKDDSGTVHYLRDNAPAHVMCFAPTRSGKGVGLVLPTLLSWRHSAIVSDLKGELFALTAGWRKQHAKNLILRFEPAAPEGSSRWNPLEDIRLGSAHESGDIRGLAQIIADPLGKGLEDFWSKSGADLLEACITHLLYNKLKKGTPANMRSLGYLLADPKKTQARVFMEMAKNSHMPDGSPHPLVASQGAAMLNKPDNERGSVISTMQSFLGLYRDPVVA